MNFKKEEYWSDIDIRLKDLISNGYVKLPSLKEFSLDEVAAHILNDMGDSTFKELCTPHETFLKDIGVEQFLTPKLYNLAKDMFSYEGDISNQYHVSRKVDPGNSKEMYRAHFDSHLFTMVLPIKIPRPMNNGSAGDLIFFPNARKFPKTEISNFIGKLYHKKFASKEGMDKFSVKKNMLTDNFNDYSPLLFVGNTTLHTNKQVTSDCSSYRLTCLAHFFDPSPKYGVGSMLRMIRSR